MGKLTLLLSGRTCRIPVPTTTETGSLQGGHQEGRSLLALAAPARRQPPERRAAMSTLWSLAQDRPKSVALGKAVKFDLIRCWIATGRLAKLGGHSNVVQHGAVALLDFGGCEVFDMFEEPPVVEQVNPFVRC